MNTWPEDLLDFAWISDMDDQLETLSGEAENEDWDYCHSSSSHRHRKPILYNYIRFAYKRLAEEGKIALSQDAQSACFNTGLVTSNQEPIYASFETNRQQDRQPWFFKGWYQPASRELNCFDDLPDMAHYFDDPTCLVFDLRKELRLNIEHIIDGIKERLPVSYKTMNDYALRSLLNGAIDNAKERVRRSYKAAIPQFYNGHVQLLLPLCISSPGVAELALVVERHQQFYRGTTCLTLDMAYNNARQISKPESDWLQP